MKIVILLTLFGVLGGVSGVCGATNRIELLTLDQALEMAERRHPQLAETRALIEAASGRAQQAGTFPNPEAILGAQQIPFQSYPVPDRQYLAGFATNSRRRDPAPTTPLRQPFIDPLFTNRRAHDHANAREAVENEGQTTQSSHYYTTRGAICVNRNFRRLQPYSFGPAATARRLPSAVPSKRLKLSINICASLRAVASYAAVSCHVSRGSRI